MKHKHKTCWVREIEMISENGEDAQVAMECVEEENGWPALYVLLDGVRIAAKRGYPDWVSLEPGWSARGNGPIDNSGLELRYTPPSIQ